MSCKKNTEPNQKIFSSKFLKKDVPYCLFNAQQKTKKAGIAMITLKDLGDCIMS